MSDLLIVNDGEGFAGAAATVGNLLASPASHAHAS